MTTNKRPQPWSDDENNAIAAVYLHMLAREIRGEPNNKAANRRETLPKLNGRSAGSYEMKACNISAVLAAVGLPWINGYKPLGHGQQRPLARALVAQMIAHGWNDDDIARLEALENGTPAQEIRGHD